MMIKATDPDLLKRLFYSFDIHTQKLYELVAKYGHTTMWYRTHNHVKTSGNLTFTRQYSGEPEDHVVYKEISDWVKSLQVTDQDYIGVYPFGNGIEFFVFKDICNLMEDR